MFVGPFYVQVLGKKSPILRSWTMYRQQIPNRWRLQIIPNKIMYNSTKEYYYARQLAIYISNKYRRPRNYREVEKRMRSICGQYKLNKDFFMLFIAKPSIGGWEWLKRNSLIDCENLL